MEHFPVSPFHTCFFEFNAQPYIVNLKEHYPTVIAFLELVVPQFPHQFLQKEGTF